MFLIFVSAETKIKNKKSKEKAYSFSLPNEKKPHICVVEIEKCKVQIMSHISLGQRYKIEGYLQINLKRSHGVRI